MYEKLSELAEFFRAAVQDKPSAREKMGNLLDSLDVSCEEDRMKIHLLSAIAQWNGQDWVKSIMDIALEEVPDACYIMAFCEFYDLAGMGMGNLRRATMYLMKCKGHEDAIRFLSDHSDTFYSIVYALQGGDAALEFMFAQLKQELSS